jgi:hypothetical protein
MFGFADWTIHVPGFRHPRVGEAAQEIISAQAKLRELHEQRAARVQQKAELLQTGSAQELAVFNAESEILDARDIPNAIAAEQAAWQEFSAAFHSTFGEVRARVQQELPAALRATRADGEATLASYRHLQTLNDVHDGVGVLHEDQSDPHAARARFERNDRHQSVQAITTGVDLGDQGRIWGLAELVDQYAQALTPTEPAPEGQAEPPAEVDFTEPGSEEAWKIRNRVMLGEARVTSYLGWAQTKVRPSRTLT